MQERAKGVRGHKGGYNALNPSPEMIQRGKDFGAWFRAAAQKKTGGNMTALAREVGVAPVNFFTYEKDGHSGDGRFKLPSRQMVVGIAKATGADVSDALRIMGYAPLNDQPQAPANIARLPEEIKQTLSRLVELLTAPDAALAAFGTLVDPAPYLSALKLPAVEASAGPGRSLDAPHSGGSEKSGVRAVLVRGACMEPYLRDGDTAIVVPPADVVDGDVVLAMTEDDAKLCKRIRIEDGGSWLEPINGEMRIPEAKFKILGVIAARVSPLNPRRGLL